MKILFDFFPLLVFFASYKLGGMHAEAAQTFINTYLSGVISGGSVTAAQAPIIVATLAGIVATFIQILAVLARGRKVDAMLWVSMFFFVVFGSMTIYFHDDNFIKWKPTMIYWCLAIAQLVALLYFKKNMIRTGMEKQFSLPDDVWHRLNLAWIAFFAVMGVVNLFVAFVLYKTDTAAWVSFKAFGATGLMFVFILGQTFYLSKHIKDEA
ncbi:MAG: septation protein A [Pseudomonadota bacterium]